MNLMWDYTMYNLCPHHPCEDCGGYALPNICNGHIFSNLHASSTGGGGLRALLFLACMFYIFLRKITTSKPTKIT